jgi:hypothetical protein
MNRIRIVRRLSCLVAGLTCVALSSAVAIPTALASPLPPPGGASGASPLPPAGGAYGASPLAPPGGAYGANPPVPPHVTGGMLGWQIALIAVGAAVLAAVLTALVGRALTARRQLAPASA